MNVTLHAIRVRACAVGAMAVASLTNASGVDAAEPTPWSWVAQGMARDERYRLGMPTDLGLLAAAADPDAERIPAWQSYYRGRYGASAWQEWPTLHWYEPNRRDPCGFELYAGPVIDLRVQLHPLPEPIAAPDDAAPLPGWVLSRRPAPRPEWVGLDRAQPCPAWHRPRPVTVYRFGGEHESFEPLDCHGAPTADAIDRLSVLSRPPGAPRPDLPLPPEPVAAGAEPGEWVPQVRLMHPRLLWVLSRLAEAFPYHPVYVISGYRREPWPSPHRQGRALDLLLMGISNEDLIAVCRELPDVGCGFYPNQPFVHVDVRAPGTGHPVWIDVSRPGRPSEYVDSWPGVVEGGALTWAGEG